MVDAQSGLSLKLLNEFVVCLSRHRVPDHRYVRFFETAASNTFLLLVFFPHYRFNPELGIVIVGEDGLC